MAWLTVAEPQFEFITVAIIITTLCCLLFARLPTYLSLALSEELK